MAVLKPVTTLFLTLVMTVTGISCACALPIAATVPVMPSAHEHEHEHEQGHMQGHEPGQMSRMDCEQQVCLNDCIDEVALIAEREPMPPVGYFQVDDDDAHDGLIFSVAALPDRLSTGPPPGSIRRTRLSPVTRFDRLIE